MKWNGFVIRGVVLSILALAGLGYELLTDRELFVLICYLFILFLGAGFILYFRNKEN